VLKQGLSNTRSSQPAPCRDVARARARCAARRSGRRAFPRLCRPKSAPSPGSRAPRRIESRAPRASLSSCRTCAVRAVDHRSVRGPGRMHACRGAPWYGGIFAVTTTSRASRPYLKLPAFPLRALHCRSRSPPHLPWPVAGELAPPSFPSTFQPAEAPP
jgi:hypothetical protein